VDNDAFQTMLAEQGERGLVGHVTRYQHVERMGSSEVEGLLDSGPITVQEKVDGANLTVARVDDSLVVCSRRRLLATVDWWAPPDGFVEAEIEDGFRGAVDYAVGHVGIKALLVEHPGWILRGEWLVKHTLNYAEGAWKKFYVFDVQLPDGSYIPVGHYDEVLSYHGICMVPLIGTFDGPPELSELVEMANRPSALGGTNAEGLVVKRYDFVNQYGRTTWGKIVQEDFVVKAKGEHGAGRHDPAEIQFVAEQVAAGLIDKTIAKIETDEGRGLESRDIPRVLGTVYHDAVVEGIWAFLKKHKGETIDFGQLQKLAYDKIRAYVLAYLSGGL